MLGSGRRPKKGLLMRKMGPSKWGKVDRPVLTAGELERPLLLVLQ